MPSSASREAYSCGAVPSSAGTGATSTTSPTCVAPSSPALSDGDGAGVTVPGSPGAACDKSTVASAALGQSGAGSGVPTSSAC
ncbi:hypothetical protein [Streptomyces sp. NBC_01579]|uniref:hypothetical protein n=1 Tax=Streptomyces sp. NBC_01579 TaxID=2975885 RepID=UPI0038682416